MGNNHEKWKRKVVLSRLTRHGQRVLYGFQSFPPCCLRAVLRAGEERRRKRGGVTLRHRDEGGGQHRREIEALRVENRITRRTGRAVGVERSGHFRTGCGRILATWKSGTGRDALAATRRARAPVAPVRGLCKPGGIKARPTARSTRPRRRRIPRRRNAPEKARPPSLSDAKSKHKRI